MVSCSIGLGGAIHPFAVDKFALGNSVRADAAEPRIEDDEKGRALWPDGGPVVNAACFDDVIPGVHCAIFIGKLAFKHIGMGLAEVMATT